MQRLVNVNPDTTSKKVKSANHITGLKYGTLPEEYDESVVSRQDKELAKKMVKVLVAKLKHHRSLFKPSKESGVKIPFVNSITLSIPDNTIWSMTINDRMIKYLSIITKVSMDSRLQFVNEKTGQFYPASTFEDLKETLQLMPIVASGRFRN